MDKERRTPLIAGNWKMNKGPIEALGLVQDLRPMLKGLSSDVVLCVPYIDLPILVSELQETKIMLGAQNCHWEEKGAFTGEVSANMLRECGCSHVILGHSERREFFGETDETVNKRLCAALQKNLTAIVCVGETLEQRENNETEEVITRQVEKAFEGIAPHEFFKIVIAYEPIWAIGTGKTATAPQADIVCALIRELIAKKYDKFTASRLRILYGGSMKPDNAKELLAQYNIDGGLIGGASLVAEDFAKIVAAAE